MAAVAEGRGVEVLAVSQLHREVSPVRDLVAAFRLAGLIRKLRPHVVHTHTAKAGAVGRVAVLLAGVRPRPIVVHTFHGHVLRGYFGPAAGERLPPARAPARARDGRPRRREPAGAGRPRRARGRAGGAVRRRPPRDRARGARRRRRRRPRADAAAARRPGRPLPRRLDRPDDRREAHGRRAARVQGAARPRRRRRAVPRRRRPRPHRPGGARVRARDRAPPLLARLPGRGRGLVRRLRRPHPPVGERGHAGERDRGARGAPARGRDRRGRRLGRRARRRRRLPRRRRATRPRWRSGSPTSPATRRCGRGWARPAASRVLERYAVARLVDDVDRLYRSLLATR